MHQPRVALVGAGYFATFHLEGWQRCGAPPVALCDLDAGRGAALAERFGVVRSYRALEAMLDEERPELLDVVLPPAAQATVVRAALARGIAVICQKPFGQNLQEATALAELAHEHHTPLVVHENFRFLPWFREARRLIDAGRLGTLHGISFRLRPGDGQGPRAYLDRQPYFQQMPRLLVRETGIHFIDTFRFLMGEVVAVSARLRRINPAIAGEDAGMVSFEFEGGASGLFDGNRLNDHPADNPRRTMGEMWLEGSAGVLRLDGNARLWFKPHGQPEQPHGYDPGSEAAFSGACTALQAHVLEHLGTGAPVMNAADDYLRNLLIQEAVYHAHATGRRVELDRFEPPNEGDTPCIPAMS